MKAHDSRAEAVQRQPAAAPAASTNRSSLPGDLRAGIESLSGMDLSDVQVHADSAGPARLNALAYAQGDEIHLAPGQDRHLPHEAWHVVQQRQGRVSVTTSAQGQPINDSPALEAEADVMGERARTLRAEPQGLQRKAATAFEGSPRDVAQRQQIRALFGPAREPLPQRRDGPAALPGGSTASGAQTVAQRVKTPVPRTFNHSFDWGGKDVESPGKFFRAHLETLHWQLLMKKAQATPEMEELNRLLALDDPALAKAEDEVVALIKRAPTTTKPSNYETPKVKPLAGEQKTTFATVVAAAVKLAKATQGDREVLEHVFGVAQAATAVDRFGEIAHIIEGWGASVGKGNADRVLLNESNAHYAAYCDGIGQRDKSKLMLGNSAFTVAQADLAGTLIHEGSHGAFGTSDLAYIPNAVFAKLSGTALSLRNADHFKLASDIAAGVVPRPTKALVVADGGHGGDVAIGIREALQQGAQLCAYKCGKVKRLIDWTILLYQSRNMKHDPGVADVHEQHMALGGPARGKAYDPSPQGAAYKTTTLTEIAVARSESFTLALRLVDGFVSADSDIAVNGNEVACKPRHSDWEGREIKYALGTARDPVAIAKIMFITTLKSFEVPPAESERLFAWHEALWERLLKVKDKAEVYHQNEDEMLLYDILRGV